MKVKIILPVLYLTLLFFYPKNDPNMVPASLGENTHTPLLNPTTNTNPFIEISGTIANYKNEEGTITDNSFWTNEKTNLGTIAINGDDFISTTISDLKLQKWNIINYDISEVFSSSEGQTKTAINKISAISELPKNLNCYAIKTE
jgi:hypothetical protein